MGLRAFVTILLSLPLAASTGLAAPEPARVAEIFARSCLDCHGTQEPEGGLVLESHAALLRGGDSGAALTPGNAADSRLVQWIEGRMQKDGKPAFMPPGKKEKLTAAEVRLIREWIDGGAPPFEPVSAPARPHTPIPPRHNRPLAIHALAYEPSSNLLAVARPGAVELLRPDTRALARRLDGFPGHVNALVFSTRDASTSLFTASGRPGQSGEIRQYNVADSTLVRSFQGHNDAIQALAVSPDGRFIASGSYDQTIALWEVATGRLVHTLKGHNGAVFALSYRKDGRILASGSADRTAKLWDTGSGERRDTLPQATREILAATFTPDGSQLLTGGGDSRLRFYRISDNAAETTNPLLESRFAHEGSLLQIVFTPDGKLAATSADDRTVKIWNTAPWQERAILEPQPDWAPALAFLPAANRLAVGRLDGTVELYDLGDGKPAPPPKPAVSAIEPRGLQRGVTQSLRLTGSGLTGIEEVTFDAPGLSARTLATGSRIGTELTLQVTVSNAVPRGARTITIRNKAGTSAPLKVFVDDFPQVQEVTQTQEIASNAVSTALQRLPAAWWGAIQPAGDIDEFEFEARARQTLVFELKVQELNSKLAPLIEILTAGSDVVARAEAPAGADVVLAHRFAGSGRHRVRVLDQFAQGSAEHAYRLTAGAFPFVTGITPLTTTTGVATRVTLHGHNLPAPAEIVVPPAAQPGAVAVPLDPDRFRSRGPLALLAAHPPQTLEIEPNDDLRRAQRLQVPQQIAATLHSARPGADIDLFQLDASAGEVFLLETVAARQGSPADTRIEVLDDEGHAVPRALVRATRNSAINFRPIDSNAGGARLDHYEEMELNEYLYLNGEIVRLFRMPQGPDSEMLFYLSNGKRRGYLDSTATAHPLEQPCFIVTLHPPGTSLPPNGLPTFIHPFANDDDALRQWGSDSRLEFTAPRTGRYLVRVTDSRGRSGPDFAYTLVARPPAPDFQVRWSAAEIAVSPGSGQMFTVTAERVDGFEGEIRVDISNLPAGFAASTPLVIEAGHTEARGTLVAATNAVAPDPAAVAKIAITATAHPRGQPIAKPVTGLQKLTVAGPAKVLVALEPSEGAADPASPLEIVLAPGQTLPARLRATRRGHDDLLTFTVENLPHGVIVDNIGLNGVLIPKGESDREIFLNAARWVPEGDRLCFAIENQAGRQTSRPVLLRIRKNSNLTARQP